MISCIVPQFHVTIKHSRSTECVTLSSVHANNNRPNIRSRAEVKCDICIWSLVPSFNIGTKEVSIRPPREYKIRINERSSIKRVYWKVRLVFFFKMWKKEERKSLSSGRKSSGEMRWILIYSTPGSIESFVKCTGAAKLLISKMPHINVWLKNIVLNQLQSFWGAKREMFLTGHLTWRYSRRYPMFWMGLKSLTFAAAPYKTILFNVMQICFLKTLFFPVLAQSEFSRLDMSTSQQPNYITNTFTNAGISPRSCLTTSEVHYSYQLWSWYWLVTRLIF